MQVEEIVDVAQPECVETVYEFIRSLGTEVGSKRQQIRTFRRRRSDLKGS